MSADAPPSYSRKRKWNIGLNLALTLLFATLILGMVNYLAARHYKRLAWSATAQAELTPLTQRIVKNITNDVQVTVFFDVHEPLYDSVTDLLREYQFLNPRLKIDFLDYVRDPARAQLVKAKYQLNHISDKDLVIFASGDRTKMVYQSEMSELDIQPLMSGQSREVRRTAFKGEMLFTSALLNVTTLRSLKAYFLEGHREHSPEDDDATKGYSKFAALLRANNIEWQRLALVGTNEVPRDCSLLVLAGPATPLSEEELNKVQAYLARGGRLFGLLNFYGVQKNDGILGLLRQWGVEVGDDLVEDKPNSNVGQDIVIGDYGIHDITKALIETRLHLVVPRSVKKNLAPTTAVDAPTVSELFYTGPKGTIISDIRNGVPYPHPATDVVTNVCLAVAVEKGKIQDVEADRGTSRLVITGDSFFLNNQMIDSAANRDFAALAINWLLDRTEMLGGLGPRPIRQYRLNITQSHKTGLYWVLLVGMPGSVLGLGFAVWMRRRQ